VTHPHLSQHDRDRLDDGVLAGMNTEPAVLTEEETDVLLAAPTQPVRIGWLDPLLSVRPSLAVLDGINEGILLQGYKVDLEGWSMFRRHVVLPFNRLLEDGRLREVREGRTTYLEAVPAPGTTAASPGTGSPVPTFKGTGNREPVPESDGNRWEPAGTGQANGGDK